MKLYISSKRDIYPVCIKKPQLKLDFTFEWLVVLAKYNHSDNILLKNEKNEMATFYKEKVGSSVCCPMDWKSVKCKILYVHLK